MARLTELHADGIGSLTRVARQLGKDANKKWRAEIRKVGKPIVTDARRRYRGRGPLGSAAARTVGLSIMQRGVQVRAGGQPWSPAIEFGTQRMMTRTHRVNNAFGRGYSLTGITKPIDYRRMFGPWKGNASTVGAGGVAGYALYPAAAAGRDEAVARLERLRDEFVDMMAKAGD